MAEEDYVRELNAWHLELAIVQDVVSHLLTELTGPAWMTSSANIVRNRLEHLVETCPFPSIKKPD